MPRDERAYRLVAYAANSEDFLEALRVMRTSISDIGRQISVKPDFKDSIELRQACVFVLTQAIDRIVRLRKDKSQRTRPTDTDDDSPNSGDGSKGDDYS